MKRLLMTAATLACLASPAKAQTQPNVEMYRESTCLMTQDRDDTADPITWCDVPPDRVDIAMDILMSDYKDSRGSIAVTWVKEHCHAEPAIPRNKWVCTEGDVTREYH